MGENISFHERNRAYCRTKYKLSYSKKNRIVIYKSSESKRSGLVIKYKCMDISFGPTSTAK